VGNPAGVDAGLTKHVRKARSVTHEPARVDIFPHRERGWNRIVRRQIRKLDAPGVEKIRTPPPSGLASSSDGAFEVVLALWSLLRLSLRRRILSGELRARFRPISRRFDFGRTQRSYTSPWLILRRRTQIFWIALWHEFV
jgi:hypothetical protein